MKRKRKWRSLYKTYGRMYRKRARKTSLPIEDKMSYADFKFAYLTLEQARLEEVTAGTRKVPNVTRDLVNSQTGAITARQAKAIAGAAESLGVKGISYMKLRMKGKDVEGAEQLWDAIKNKRSELFKQGLSKGEVTNEISSSFFGS